MNREGDYPTQLHSTAVDGCDFHRNATEGTIYNPYSRNAMHWLQKNKYNITRSDCLLFSFLASIVYGVDKQFMDMPISELVTLHSTCAISS